MDKSSNHQIDWIGIPWYEESIRFNRIPLVWATSHPTPPCSFSWNLAGYLYSPESSALTLPFREREAVGPSWLTLMLLWEWRQRLRTCWAVRAHPKEATSSSPGGFSFFLRKKIQRASFSPELEKEALTEHFIDGAVSIEAYVMMFLPSHQEGSSPIWEPRSKETWGHVRVKVECHVLSQLANKHLSSV